MMHVGLITEITNDKRTDKRVVASLQSLAKLASAIESSAVRLTPKDLDSRGEVLFFVLRINMLGRTIG